MLYLKINREEAAQSYVGPSVTVPLYEEVANKAQQSTYYVLIPNFFMTSTASIPSGHACIVSKDIMAISK